ncbi:MAG TPA: hypothetical protein GXX23_08250 [Firmicutes bacterium]|nr:hypothetical protein [Candidatus Fermentithermobacillaceae bacterium]
MRRSWATAVQSIDRRVLYALTFVIVLLPLVRPLGFPLNITPNTRRAFEIIDALPEGSLVFHSVGFDPSGDAEVWPQMQALSRHFMSKGLRIVYFPTNVGGDMYAEAIRAQLAPKFGYEYGRDFAILPFKAGGAPAIAAMADFYSLYTVDRDGTPLSELPIFDGFRGMQDVSLITTSSTGDDALFLAVYLEPKFHIPIVVGGAATIMPVLGPYLASGQIKGIISGLAGAAEYEVLSEMPGQAIGAMDAQSAGHLFIACLVILGNVGFFAQSRAVRRKEGV